MRRLLFIQSLGISRIVHMTAQVYYLRRHITPCTDPLLYQFLYHIPWFSSSFKRFSILCSVNSSNVICHSNFLIPSLGTNLVVLSCIHLLFWVQVANRQAKGRLYRSWEDSMALCTMTLQTLDKCQLCTNMQLTFKALLSTFLNRGETILSPKAVSREVLLAATRRCIKPVETAIRPAHGTILARRSFLGANSTYSRRKSCQG